MTRLRGVVIDLTAAGIMKQLPKYNRRSSRIPGVHVSARRTLLSGQNRIHAIKELCRLCLGALRIASRSRTNPNKTISFTLNHKNPEKKNGKVKFKRISDTSLQILVIYLSKIPFEFEEDFDENLFPTQGLEPIDSKIKEETLKTKEFKSVQMILRSIFSISNRNVPSDTIDFQKSSTDFMEIGEESGSAIENFQTEQRTAERMKEPEKQLTWYATFQLKITSSGSSVAEKILDSVLFLLTEPSPYPYILQVSPEYHFLSKVGRPDFTSSGITSRSCRALALTSIRVHEDVSSSLQNYSICMHEGLRVECPPCKMCFEVLQYSYEKIKGINPPLASICDVILGHYIQDTPALRNLASALSLVIDDHIEHALMYFNRLDNSISKESLEYWNTYGSVNIGYMEDTTNIAEETGICFPGREMYRPTISFEGPETKECNKTILRTDTHSDGILTVQCVCETPKLLGFVVMRKPESTEVALTSILTHFKVPPRFIFYDNACNLFSSFLLRVPWLLQFTKLMVDRFHYKSHTCSSLFDPGSYKDLDTFNTTAAESINARIEKVLFFLRYLRGKNYVPFLRARFALLNFSALIREESGKKDLEEITFWRKFQSYFVCDCVSCVNQTNTCPLGEDNEHPESVIADDRTTMRPRNS